MNQTPILSIIVVNYRSASSLERLLVSLEQFTLPTEDYEIIVSNNDLREKELIDALAEQYPFRAIHCAKNIGFGAANNRGVAIARGKYLFFCNPDTEFVSGNIREALTLFETHTQPSETKSNPSSTVSEPFENRLLGVSRSGTNGFQLSELPQEQFAREEMVPEEIGKKTLQNRSTPGIIGFRLVDSAGKPERWSVGTDVSLWETIRNNLGFPPGRKLWESKRLIKVGRVSGAALLIPKKLFDTLGGFDENFFLYFEDADLCYRTKRIGRTIIYYPLVTLRHQGGMSMPSHKEQKCHYSASQVLYFRKHRLGWENTLLRWTRKIFG